MPIHALKVEEVAEQVYGSLKGGVGRFGWSYMKDDNGLPLGDADLHRLKLKIASTGWGLLPVTNKIDINRSCLNSKTGIMLFT
jgi:hypothetical protein